MINKMNRELFKDWTLMLITDERWCPFGRLLKNIGLLSESGVDILQYRDKVVSDRIYCERLSALKSRVRGGGMKIIANDRVDAALCVDVDGVHLGQDDISPSLARKILGKKKIIGISVHTRREFERSVNEPVDYFSVGAIFHTRTKKNYIASPSDRLLRWFIDKSPVPVIGVGGIQLKYLGNPRLEGLKGIAVSRGILSAKNYTRIIPVFKQR